MKPLYIRVSQDFIHLVTGGRRSSVYVNKCAFYTNILKDKNEEFKSFEEVKLAWSSTSITKKITNIDEVKIPFKTNDGEHFTRQYRIEFEN